MKILHAPFIFHLDPVGGTEVYVRQLAAALHELGIIGAILAPGADDTTYAVESLPVFRYALPDRAPSLAMHYGKVDPSLVMKFDRLLHTIQPDILHLHAFVARYTPALCTAARARRLPVVYTYHTPTGSCVRGTLLQWGESVCHGELAIQPCSRCYLHGLGLNRRASHFVGSLPQWVGQLLSMLHLAGNGWTALQMTHLLSIHQQTLRQFWHHVDRIITLCAWTTDLLQLNGVPPTKLTLCRHGITGRAPLDSTPTPQIASNPPLRLVFLGRLDPTKGADVLIQAVRALPNAPVLLDMYGVAQDSGATNWQQNLLALADGDPRIRLLAPIPHAQVVATLHTYHLLAVPALWLETGPLVVLEAFAAGIPVLGSRLGGIAELVVDDHTGLLLPPGDITAWSRAIQRVLDDPPLLERLRSNVTPPRTMAKVAEEMADVYTLTIR